MAKVTAAQFADKWGRRLNAASADIKTGVNAVQVAPGEAAAAAQDRMLTNLMAAVNSGFWAKQVSGVSLNDWKDAMINKGIGRIAAGVTQAQKTKIGTFTRLLSAVDSAAAEANAIPKGDINQSIARAAAFMTAMHGAKAGIRGGA